MKLVGILGVSFQVTSPVFRSLLENPKFPSSPEPMNRLVILESAWALLFSICGDCMAVCLWDGREGKPWGTEAQEAFPLLV